MKIRTRLLLYYTIVTLIAVPFFSASTYFGARHLMLEALEDERELLVSAIEGHFDPAAGTFTNLAADNLYLNVDMEEAYMVIYDASGQPVYRSPMADRIQLSFPLARDKPELVTIIKKDSEAMPVFHPAASEMIRFHAVSRKLFHQGELVGWLNVASSMDDIDDSLRSLIKTLFGAKLIVLVLLLGGGYFITRKSLRPVAAMAAKAKRISSANLDERIKVENESDEIGQLATVLNNLLDRLQQAFVSQQQFMADAAHELKTPITILRTNWEDELNNPEVPQEFKERLVADIETITRLSRVINDLLLLSQTESVRQSFVLAPLRLDELVRDVASDMDVLAKMKDQSIEVRHTEPATVKGDRDRLYQLIFNLLDNAIKYTPDGGTITIGVGVDGRTAVLTVRDTGPGIPQADLPFIFERFYRVDQDRSRKTGGSGLGLSICKMIAETHMGEVRVGSEQGKGALFEVRLPITD